MYYTRKQALALAKQLRTCPPLSIKQSDHHAEQIDAHNRICPFCTTFLKDEIEAWDDFVQHLESDFSAALETPPAAPGQIRKLDPDLGCWKNNYYYTPPDVLILSVDGRIITVAQIWPDITLAGPGDLAVPKNLMHGQSELFVESWNIYAVDQSFLGPCTGTVENRVVEAVLQMNEAPDVLPSWAIVPIPLKENDPRQFFRELEIETGYTFASMAVPLLVTHVEKETKPDTLESMITRIKNKIPDIDWDWVPQSIDACLAALRFPDHALPMNAAQDDTRYLTAAYCAFDGENLDSVVPVECRVEHKAPSCDPFSISGVIDAPEFDFTGDEFKGFIKDSTNRTLTACDVHVDPGQRRFMAVFDRPLNAEEHFCLVILHKNASFDR